MAGDFFASKKAMAVFKHGILHRYPVVFASKTAKDLPDHRVAFLDGYAGRGEYEGGEPGSPLLFCRAAAYVRAYRNVQGFYVEQNRDNFLNLERVLREKGQGTEWIARHGDINQHLPELLRITKEASLFAFLDPFGPALDFATMKGSLLGRPPWPRTEVLLHFSVLSVARMGSKVHAARRRQGTLSPADAKLAERLDRFLGGFWWQEHFAQIQDEDDVGTATDVAMRVWAEYQRLMLEGTAFQAIQMPVRPRPDLLPKYVLVLFTQSNHGAWYFADALGKAGVEWSVAWQTDQIRKGEAPGQVSLFGDALLPTAESYVAEWEQRWVKAIADNIDALLSAGAPFAVADRVPDVYGTTLGQAGAPQARKAVKELYARGAVSNRGVGERWWQETLRRP